MDDLQREKKKGLSMGYLKDVLFRRKLIGKKYQTPGFGLTAQLFASMSKVIIERLGPDEGEKLIREAVENFGRERGRRIAQRVTALGKPLSFKNWLIYTDIDGANFPVKPYLDNADLLAPVTTCSFHAAAREWGLEEYANIYCKYADFAILDGYNPHVKLELEQRFKTGKDHCLFRYIVKDNNK
ncbi:MAG: hypothetical protein CVV44_02590 [Spirochaetae bacterium HGW-Spirochaetae-1]|nr:MAG: hypothetical protein CVV44_02590 [Spirochaetae bacterium HGW-Spirochaetae-1]